MSAPIRLTMPFDPEALAGLTSGDAVLLSGAVYTARDAAHARFAETIARGEPLPVDFAGQTIAVILAKADSSAAVDSFATALGGEVPVIALVKSAAGILAAPQIAAHPSVVRLAFGSVAYAAELGVDHHVQDAMLFARGALVVASAAAGSAAPIDGVTTEFGSPELAADDTAAGRRIGFTGKLCIHPAQIAPTHTAFLPTADEVAWAKRILAEWAGGAGNVGEEMVDPPVLLRARRILGDRDPA